LAIRQDNGSRLHCVPNCGNHTSEVDRLVGGGQHAFENGGEEPTDGAVEIFDTATGAVLQQYLYNSDPNGSYAGIEYSADGKYLVFSEGYNGYVNIATGNAQSVHSGFSN